MFSENPARCGLGNKIVKTILPEYNLREGTKI